MRLEFTKPALQVAVLIVSCALIVSCTSTSWATTTEYIFTSTTTSSTSSPSTTEEYLEETTTDSSTTTTYPSTTVSSSTTTSTTTTQFDTTTQSETSSSVTYTTMSDLPTTTSDLSTTTSDLPTTTSDPSTTTSDPSTTTSDPSTTTSDPSTTTSDPSTTTSDPSTITSDPSTTTSDPSTITSDPSTITSHPATTPSHPSTITTNADRPTTIPSIPTSSDVQNDTCSNSPCLNGGLCRTTLQGYTCYCPGGFSGEICDTEKDDRTQVPVSVLAGAIVGCVVLFSAVIIVVVCIFRRKISKGETHTGSLNPNSIMDRKQTVQESLWIQDEPLRLYEPMADTNIRSETQTEGSNYADLYRTPQEDTYDQLNTTPQYVQMGQIGPQFSQEFTTSNRDSTYNYVNQL